MKVTERDARQVLTDTGKMINQKFRNHYFRPKERPGETGTQHIGRNQSKKSALPTRTEREVRPVG